MNTICPLEVSQREWTQQTSHREPPFVKVPAPSVHETPVQETLTKLPRNSTKHLDPARRNNQFTLNLLRPDRPGVLGLNPFRPQKAAHSHDERVGEPQLITFLITAAEFLLIHCGDIPVVPGPVALSPNRVHPAKLFTLSSVYKPKAPSDQTICF
jgi:hypothetical protein